MGKKWTVRRLWRRGHGRAGEHPQLLLSIVLGLTLAFFLIHHFDRTLRPHLVALTQTQLQNQLTHIADSAVTHTLSDQSLSYKDIVHLQPRQDESFSIISTDTAQLNALRSTVMEDIVTQVELLDSRSLGVPLGALTGLDLLAAWGPSLPVQVLSVSSAEGTFHSDLTSAGINQTLHRIVLDVTVTARLLLPGGVVETSVSTPVYVTETILVGEVPQTYLQLLPAQ